MPHRADHEENDVRPVGADLPPDLQQQQTALENGISRAQQNLLRLQHEEGFWTGELFADSTLCSDYVLFMHWAEEIDPVLEEKCAAHIRRRQLPDGGWNIYEGGPSEVSASVKAYFALKLAGHLPAQPWMQEARACILRLGGIPRMNTYAKLYLALLGQFRWQFLPTMPVEVVFMPQWFLFNIYDMSSWSRAMLMPLAILNHYKPSRQLPADKQLHELYPVGSEQGDLGINWRTPRLSWPNFFLVCDVFLKLLHKLPWKPWRAAALARAEAWMTERMGEGSDGLGAIFPAMLNALIALKTLGYQKDHPVYLKAKRDFEGLFVDDPQDFRIQPCLSPVWDTSINMIALLESGIAPTSASIQQAARWLVEKEVRICGDWYCRNPHREPSGWAFEFNNVYYPDTDDTMMVLMALRLVAPTDEREARARFARALRWLLSFQCRDGGWAAFDRDVMQRWLEDVPFADHNAILDPTCSDLTGRVLELLGYIGYDRESAVVFRATSFIRETQEDDGSWYGRWGVNYIYGTWQVLRGLRAVGEDMRQPWILRARDWLESCQNEDGGWGETCASYEDPHLKGKGPSTPSQTAWALMGLIAACDPARPADLERRAIRRGVEFLLERQSADGSWPEPETTGTGFPSVFYLRYDMYRNNWPLLALATWRNYRTGVFHAPNQIQVGSS
ncbi:MAG: squalene-hopene/tetraprenyl-beta-curcumene cyclase [Chthoniobacter sp.]|jgi:squalene-hopene/tetraprenyl-beta-curcumene cyclase|nr:squalene-hopene/tetraprenyl-beta-curcumene cyclase [Chthoniobacter sp.]